MNGPDPAARASSDSTTWHLRCYRGIEDAWAALPIGKDDRTRLKLEVRGLGRPDPGLGEYVAVERLSLYDAVRNPLARTPESAIDGQGRRPTYYVRAVRTPSGRLFHLQRRYPPESEVEAWMSMGAAYPEPSLRIREILLPPDLTVEAHHEDWVTVTTLPAGELGEV